MGKAYSITINKGRCVLCRYCEVVCSIALTGDFDPDISIIKEIKPKDSPDQIECIHPEACQIRPQCIDACEYRAIKFEEIQ